MIIQVIASVRLQLLQSKSIGISGQIHTIPIQLFTELSTEEIDYICDPWDQIKGFTSRWLTKNNAFPEINQH